MNISDVISHCLKTPPLMYAQSGECIKQEQFRKEYGLVKNYFLHHFNDDSIVALRFNKDYVYVLNILVCMEIGLTYIPLSIDFPEERIEQIRQIATFDALIDEKLFGMMINSASLESQHKHFSRNDEKLLYIMFTSGSTGKPKGVEIQRKAYANFLQWLDSYFPVTSGDIVLNATEFTFDVSLIDVGLLIVKHSALVFSNFQNDIFKLLFEMEKYNITTIATVPNNFSMILVDEIVARVDLHKLKYAFIAGSRFPLSLYNKFPRYLPCLQVYNCYGPTEFTIYCLTKKLYESNDIQQETITIGKPILNTKFKIVNDDLEEVSIGVKGELAVSGAQLMRGYKNLPEKTQEVVVVIDGELYYKTGDIAFADDERNCYISGRLDDTVKVTGFRVNLSDIDSYIQKIPYMKDSATIYIEVNDLEGYLVSCLILNHAHISEKEIMSDLKNILPTFQRPKHIILLDNFPLNTSGKVCKKTLLSNFQIKYGL